MFLPKNPGSVCLGRVVTYEIINSQDLSNGVIAKGTLLYDEKYELEYRAKKMENKMFCSSTVKGPGRGRELRG